MEGSGRTLTSAEGAGGERVSLTEDVAAYIPGDRRRALASGTAMPEQVHGAALFADISGFTPLSEVLAAELGPQRGAEEVTATLELVFDAVLSELHRFGGSVISFSGDAVTCWFEGDDGVLAAACGLEMQRAMASVATITTPKGREVQLAMKVAVAAGTARRFVVGDPDIQLIDTLAGTLMDRLAGAEHAALRGEVVVDGASQRAVGARLELGELRGSPDEPVGVVRALLGPVAPVAEPTPIPELPESVVRQWLLPAVYERMQAGLGEFLSELRPAVPMFIRFGGIDYDSDPRARDRLDDFVRKAQRVIDDYGGNVLQMTIGDKGAYLYAVFGSPLAHEDDAARACRAALAVLALEAHSAVSGLQVGITSGRLRSGTNGHRHRRTFTCLGDVVNLAARLMSAAPPGQVYVTAELAAAAGPSLVFEELPLLEVKGKSAPIAVRRLVAASGAGGRRRSAHPIVGRECELEMLLERATRARAGEGQVVGVVAEAGMGKSRLVDELVHALSADGLGSFPGAASSVGAASYRVFEPIFTAMFGLTGDGDAQAELTGALEAVDASLVPRLPLLSAVLPIEIEDNAFTAGFDAKLRKSSLESLLLGYVTARAGREPLVMVLEDCHWIDGLSRDLLDVLARAIAALPVLVVLTYRPGSFEAPALAHTTLVGLDRLDAAASRQLVGARVADLYGADTRVPDSLMAIVTERAEGNPFYLEELVNYLHAGGAVLADGTAAASMVLPDSLASLVLSRIDTLGESPRQALKVASVVGREFAGRALAGAYPELGSAPHVRRQLRRLCSADLVVAEDPVLDAYAFKHAVIREVAYESLPFALRTLVHGRIGAWLEDVEPQNLEALAHHYLHSSDDEKKRLYLIKAGEAAQARYANDAAVGHYRRVVALLAEDERVPVLMKLGAVLELRGEWAEAASVFGEVLALAERLGEASAVAGARAARADVMRKQGRFEDAVAELELAGGEFEAVGDAAGLGRVAHLRGTIAAQRGEYGEARRQYEASLQIRRDLGEHAAEASLLSNLAIVAEYEQDYDRAQQLNELALELRTRLADRWGIGVSENNLGMIAHLQGRYDEARRRLQEALRIELEVGDLWMVAIVHHNLANATRELADAPAARRHYAEALRIYGITGDLWAQCLVFEDVAMLAAPVDAKGALALVGAADAIREVIGSPRVAAQQTDLDARLRPARSLLGEAAAAAAHGAGRALDARAAQELAGGLLGAVG
ncbi:MAG: tetratricopeptide repeat protein [Actinomycetota bacterium]|nr:tetratricopeptide repeat protein [Actinomycetota bacterium]